jgi:hypothetical protein
MDVNKIVQASRSIAQDSVPASGNAYSGIIFEIFRGSPGKHFSPKNITALFAAEGEEVKGVSSVLFQLKKAGKLTSARKGWYCLAGSSKE